MKTHPSLLAPVVAALLLAGITGCQSSGSTSSTRSTPAVGPSTSAVQLSVKRTYAIVGRTDSTGAITKPEDPNADDVSQVIRAKLASLGYQEQATSPDFLVSVTWSHFKQAVQPSVTDTQAPVTAPIETIEQAKLSIVARDSSSGKTLWQSPESEPVDPHMVSGEQTRTLASAALKDFPPSSQTAAQ